MNNILQNTYYNRTFAPTKKINMRYLQDYKEMMAGEFIDQKLLKDLKNSNVILKIENLRSKLDEYNKDDVQKFREMLYLMTEFSCIKSAIEMKVTVNTINDKKYKEKIYLQSRGAVKTGKSARVWASHYHGLESNFADGRKNKKLMEDGRTVVMNKIIVDLMEEFGM
jgi:hypothetical protein